MITFVINPNFRKIFPEKALEQYCKIALDYFGQPDTDITVVVDNDTFIQNFNRQYRGIDAPTDVLSFTLDYPDPETGRRHLGDIVISAETVEKNAAANGHSLLEETRLMIVHGILHLLGYDHASADEEKEMWGLQAEIIEKIKSQMVGE
jgi:probable rRNA maturation factor